MANCPKCGIKLKLTDIDQYCPKCGVNMRLYGFEENFYKEAKTAELSQAGWSCRIRRFKMSMVGSKLIGSRLGIMFLPILTLLIPSGSAVLSFPFRESEIALSALGLYNAYTGGEFNLIMSLASGSAEAEIFTLLKLMLILIAAASVFAFFVFCFSVFAFASIKKMQKVIFTTAGLGIISTVAAIVNMYLLASRAKDSVMMNVSAGFGLYAVLLAFAVVFAVNVIIEKKGIKVEYAEGMVERSEIWEKVKSGEINIDDLPYPVVETEETRKIKAEILAEREEFRKENEAEKEGRPDEEKA